MKIYIKAHSYLRRYVKAYWYDDEPAIDDFIYEPTHKSNYEEDSDEFIDDDPYGVFDTDYGDFDEYDRYGYSEYQDFYKEIKKRKIYVPLRVSKDIPDYNAYRKSLFGTLYLSMQSGESIETIYNEFSRTFPGIVKSGFVNESDMLLEIVDAVLYAQSILKPH